VKLNKDVTICFRTSAKLQAGLRAAAEHGQVNVSSLINSLLSDYLDSRSRTDKRRHNRKGTSIPVIIHGETDAGKVLLTGVIQDVSLGGVRISVPKSGQRSLSITADAKNFEIVFRLQDGSTRPVSMICKPARVSPAGDSMQIGASFQDGDLQSYFEIQNFLM